MSIPAPAPIARIPQAKPLYLLKYWPTVTNKGFNVNPAPRPEIKGMWVAEVGWGSSG